jgi:hypothetical protein
MEQISAELQAFIFANFETIDQLRILLLLQNNPERSWNAMSITAILRIQQEAAQDCLDRLHRRGLLVLEDLASRRYAYRPDRVELDRMARAVAELDRTRPVTLIKLIYARPDDARQAGGGTQI